MSERQSLLGKSQAEDLLGIDPSDMSSVGQYLHQLALPGITRLYPQVYIQGLSQSMRQRTVERPSEMAKYFSGGEIAALAITQAEQELHRAITGRFVDLKLDDLEQTEHGISVADLSEVLCLGRSETINYLVQDGTLTAYEQEGGSFIGETALRSAVCWQRPTSFPGAPMADVVRVVETDTSQRSV